MTEQFIGIIAAVILGILVVLVVLFLRKLAGQKSNEIDQTSLSNQGDHSLPINKDLSQKEQQSEPSIDSPEIELKSEQQGDVFISYRREDSADIVGRIYDRLVDQFGETAIFKDVDSIPLGVNYRNYLDTTVGHSRILVAIIGQQWISVADSKGTRRLDNPADFVRIEV